jgi:hypothetical protein
MNSLAGDEPNWLSTYQETYHVESDNWSRYAACELLTLTKARVVPGMVLLIYTEMMWRLLICRVLI